MNIEKLYRALIEDEEIKDIPVLTVIRVACVILKLINEGNCFNITEV